MRSQRKKARPCFDASFDEPVILFDNVVQVLDWRSSHLLRMAPSSFSSLKAFGDAAFLSTVMTRGGHSVRRGKRFGEKVLGRFGIACRNQEELERVADRESTAR